MIKRQILGAVTILAALPGLLFILYFISSYNASLLHWLVIEKIITALFCFIGGGLLLKGNAWGYRLSLVGWILIIWASISSLLAAWQPVTSGQLQTNMFAKEAIYLAVGLPTVIILIREMIRIKRFNNAIETDRD